MLKWPLVALQAIVSPVLIILILLQSSKGDDLGALAGGGGGSSSVLGTGGASKLLVRLTVIFAITFMVNSVLLAKIFKESAQASIGASQQEPLAPAANALQLDAVAPNAVAPATSAAPQGK